MMNSKAYDLLVLVKVGYDPTKDETMGKSVPEVTKSKSHGLNETQKKLQCKDYSIKSSIAGLGYTPKPPLRVMVQRMANYHIAERPEPPGDSEEPQESIASSFLVNTMEEEVPVEPSKLEDIVHVPGHPTTEKNPRRKNGSGYTPLHI
ncbi:hypothetical protein LIER_13365 [Lithospermum erythrorhizon]|uniref:Uncharacterized protein n=1 Tax=Lithospermum erythrorhizon TaxID=34254 RepID=A0AAV3PV66_LITER